jgi:hypothetical protein
MKLLFDQNLSFKLCALLADLFPDPRNRMSSWLSCEIWSGLSMTMEYSMPIHSSRWRALNRILIGTEMRQGNA